VGSIYRRIARCKFEVPEQPGIVLKIKTENGEVVLKGPSFNCRVLRELLALKAEGVESYSCAWFWYDSDSCKVEPDEMYSFFVVSGDRIVREAVSFFDNFYSGFDPDIFKPAGDSDFLWSNEADWLEARTRFWYRKFYSETRTGQLMVLRPDEPILYAFERPQAPGPDIQQLPSCAASPGEVNTYGSQDSGLGNFPMLSRPTARDIHEMQSTTLLKTYRLLWVALPLLVAIAFPSVKDYMAIAAAILGASFLWFCWETRKVGRP